MSCDFFTFFYRQDAPVRPGKKIERVLTNYSQLLLGLPKSLEGGLNSGLSENLNLMSSPTPHPQRAQVTVWSLESGACGVMGALSEGSWSECRCPSHPNVAGI